MCGRGRRACWRLSRRWVEVAARRTGADYRRFMQHVAQQFPTAEKIILVQDDLNTHSDASFYQSAANDPGTRLRGGAQRRPRHSPLAVYARQSPA